MLQAYFTEYYLFIDIKGINYFLLTFTIKGDLEQIIKSLISF